MATLEQKAVEIIDKLQSHAPQATDLALKSVQVDAWSNLILGGFFLIAFLGGLIFWRLKYLPWYRQAGGDDSAQIISGVGLVVFLGMSLIIALVQLLDIW